MRVRRIILEEDYPVIRTWWEDRGVQAPSQGLLPYTGVMAENNGVPVACAFLYEDKGGVVGMIEWEATNPEVKSAMDRIRGLNLIFQFFEEYCIEKGMIVLFSWVAAERGDGRILERRKWKQCPGERHALMMFEHAREEAPCQR